MATITNSRPTWYTSEDDTAWEKIKAAFHRDWRQTKHDMGGKEPDLDQHLGDTISQAAGSKPIPPANAKTPHPATNKSDEYSEEYEPAYRYGYAACRQYGANCEWDDAVEANVRKDWSGDRDWNDSRDAIRRGWEYRKSQGARSSV